MSSATTKIYSNVLSDFSEFVHSVLDCTSVLPATEVSVALYISFLLEKGRATSTVMSAISALAIFHKVMSLPDPTVSFLVKRVLMGVQKTVSTSDIRCPISYPMLGKLIDSAPSVTDSMYEAALLRAMYVLMFHGLLRIGEATK